MNCLESGSEKLQPDNYNEPIMTMSCDRVEQRTQWHDNLVLCYPLKLDVAEIRYGKWSMDRSRRKLRSAIYNNWTRPEVVLKTYYMNRFLYYKLISARNGLCTHLNIKYHYKLFLSSPSLEKWNKMVSQRNKHIKLFLMINKNFKLTKCL